MVIEGSYFQSVFRKEIKKFDWDVAPLPKGPKGRASMFYSHCWVMSANTRYPKETWGLIKAFAGIEAAEKFAKKGIDMPVYNIPRVKNAYLESEEKPAHRHFFIDALDYIVQDPLYRSYIPIREPYDTAIYNIKNKNADVKEELDKAVPQMQRMLDQFLAQF